MSALSVGDKVQDRWGRTGVVIGHRPGGGPGPWAEPRVLVRWDEVAPHGKPESYYVPGNLIPLRSPPEGVAISDAEARAVAALLAAADECEAINDRLIERGIHNPDWLADQKALWRAEKARSAALADPCIRSLAARLGDSAAGAEPGGDG